MAVIALVSDLVFGSKISATAAVTGTQVRVFRSANDIRNNLADAAGLILDLSLDEQSVLELVRDAKAARPGLHIVGFLPHVAVELARAAREAGVDEVLPRSKFSAHLADVLTRLARPQPDGA